MAAMPINSKNEQEKSKVKLKRENLRKGKANRKMKKKKTEKAAAVFKKSTAGTEANNNYKGTKKQRRVKVWQDNKKIFCQVCNVETNGNKNHERGIGSSILVVNRRQWVRKDLGGTIKIMYSAEEKLLKASVS